MTRSLAITALLTVAVAASACTDANQSAQLGAADGTVAPGATCAYPPDGEPARAVDAPGEHSVPNRGTVQVVMHMTAGDVTLTLDQAKAPCTVHSFLSLASQGYFDDTSCHRLVDHGMFILQCGDPTGTGRGGPGYTFADEIAPGTAYPRGTIAMANRGPDTNGSQFFLVWDDTDLSPDYTVFGTIDDAGLGVVGGIAAQGVDASDGISPNAEALITGMSIG